MDVTTYTDANLAQQFSKLSDEILKFELADPVDKKALATLYAKLSTINDEQARRVAASATVIKPEVQSKPQHTEMGKDMRMALDRIPEFGPGGDTSTFIAALENIHKNYVADHASLEPRYVKYAITRLCSSFQTQVHGHTPKVATWTSLKKFIGDNYGLRLTPYQKLDTLFDLKADSDWPSYAVKLQNCANEVALFVEEKWKKGHPNEALTVKHVFDLIATEVFLRRLQDGADKEAYNYICGQLDDVWEINGALAKAQDWLSRANRVDDAGLAADGATFFGRGNPAQNKRNQPRSNSKQQNSAKGEQKPRDQDDRRPFPPLALHKTMAPDTCYFWAYKECTKQKCSRKHEWPESKPKKDAKTEAQADTFYNSEGFC